MGKLRKIAGVVIAAGRSRISGRSKLLSLVDGEELVCRATRVLESVFEEVIIVVTSNNEHEIRLALQTRGLHARCVVQKERKGSVDAVRIAAESLGARHAVVVLGDASLWLPETMQEFARGYLRQRNAVMAVAAAKVDRDSPRELYGFDRIVLDGAGSVRRILVRGVHEGFREADPRVVNLSLYALDLRWVGTRIDQVRLVDKERDGGTSERMLPDLAEVAGIDGKPCCLIHISGDPRQAFDVDTLADLSRAQTLISELERCRTRC